MTLRQHLFAFFQGLQGFVALAFLDQLLGQLGETHAVRVAGAHHGLIDVDFRIGNVAVAELLHEVVVHAFGVYTAVTEFEGRDTGGEAFEHQVVVQTGLVVAAKCGAHVERAGPIVVGQHFVDHYLALSEDALAAKRDKHLVGDAVLAVGELHSAAQYGGFVHGHDNGVGGHKANLGITHEIVDDVFQFERIVLLTLGLEIVFELEQLLFRLGFDEEHVASHVVNVLPTLPSDGQ